MPRVHLTLVHASDLHIGQYVEQNGFSFVQGFASHDIQLCVGFAEALVDAEIRADESGLPVVVTGDLTAGGRVSEFTTTHTFLRAQWVRSIYGQDPTVGLALTSDRLATVPGNHDHWDGTRFPAHAYRPAAVAPHFRPGPWHTSWTEATGKLGIDLFGLDSNSGLIGRNPLGQGDIDPGDLNTLEALLAGTVPTSQSERRVRVVMLHHSLAYRHGKLIPKVLSPLILSQASVDRLLDMSTKYNVCAILTGHTHDAFYKDWQFGGRPNSVRELRCPATLQGPAAFTGAGFLMHQIWTNDNANFNWTTWHYAWDGSEFVLPDPPRPMVQFKIA